jgi:hypothetical protein
VIFQVVGGWLGGVFGTTGGVTPGPAFHPNGRTFTVSGEDTTFLEPE